jgi:hypothetical protein
VNWFVLNTEANVEVDITALDAVEALRLELHRRGILFALARVKHELREDLDAYGLTAGALSGGGVLSMWLVAAFAQGWQCGRVWDLARHGRERCSPTTHVSVGTSAAIATAGPDVGRFCSSDRRAP